MRTMKRKDAIKAIRGERNVLIVVGPVYAEWAASYGLKHNAWTMTVMVVTDDKDFQKKMRALNESFDAIVLAPNHGTKMPNPGTLGSATKYMFVYWKEETSQMVFKQMGRYRTLTLDAVVLCSKWTSRVHLLTCHQGCIIEELLANRSITRNIIVSGHREHVNGGEEKTTEGESIFCGGERWQLKFIFCGLPYGRTLRKHKHEMGCKCVPPGYSEYVAYRKVNDEVTPV
jgi:hypothetical protein